MAEHLSPNQPESLEDQPQPESAESARERAERLASLETKAEADKTEQIEQLADARAEIDKVEEAASQPAPPEKSGASQPGDLPAAKKQIYAQSLRTIQDHLPSKAGIRFSRFIHRPAIEKISEATAKTVMRPSLTLGVSLGTLVGSGFFLYLAKKQGFALRGGEFLLSAGLGGLIGLAIEGIYRVVRRLARKTKAEPA